MVLKLVMLRGTGTTEKHDLVGGQGVAMGAALRREYSSYGTPSSFSVDLLSGT